MARAIHSAARLVARTAEKDASERATFASRPLNFWDRCMAPLDGRSALIPGGFRGETGSRLRLQWGARSAAGKLQTRPLAP
jgi:hypothetical protein